MAEITFDATDPQATEARQAEEARLIELGEKVINDEEARQQDTYDRAKAAEESELRYAGKFKSAEDLENAYKELEKKLGQKEDSPTETTDQPEAEAQTSEESTPLDDTVQFIRDASDEYFSNENQLKPETVQKLKEMPSEQLIDAYLQMQKDLAPEPGALSDADASAIMTAAGGEQAYNETLAWAADNLSPDEVAAYDNVINSGNKDAIFFAVNSLTQRYKDAVGFEGARVSGKSIRSSVQGYRSQAELARAISDPRYRNDPGYRLDVQEKLAASGDLL